MTNRAILALLGLSGGVGLLRARAAKWRRETAAMIEQLEREAMANPEPVQFADFETLPAPVAAYFRLALQDGQTPIRTATIRHRGQFCLNEKWITFVSTQHFSAHPAAFVWDAKMRMNALLSVRVRDSFLGGRGAMSARIGSVFSVVNAHDDANLDAGALMRYLAELVWLPTALLPSQNLKWTAIDDHKALATLSDGNTTVSLEFTFNECAEISGIFTPARFHSSPGGVSQSFPWTGRMWNYERRNGMMIPLEAEVAWQMPGGEAPYYRAKMTAFQTT